MLPKVTILITPKVTVFYRAQGQQATDTCVARARLQRKNIHDPSVESAKDNVAVSIH
jgi:hypothetical protein